MPLIRDNALVLSSAVDHDARVQQVVRAHVAAIAKRIRAANP
jgi:hypothetical protein